MMGLKRYSDALRPSALERIEELEALKLSSSLPTLGPGYAPHISTSTSTMRKEMHTITIGLLLHHQPASVSCRQNGQEAAAPR